MVGEIRHDPALPHDAEESRLAAVGRDAQGLALQPEAGGPEGGTDGGGVEVQAHSRASGGLEDGVMGTDGLP